MKKLVVLTSCFLGITLQAQEKQDKTEFKKTYWASVSELIFSAADLGNVRIYEDGVNYVQAPEGNLANPVPRFSAFFHAAQQFHVNFARFAGFYTGLGFRNIGMINNLNDTIRLKQRAYGVSIPLALKFGDMEKRKYLTLGAEAEYMFHYKQKVFVGEGRGDKDDYKLSEWFSNRVNAFNPGVFVEFNFGKSGYFRIKYYLNDFLNASTRQDFRIGSKNYHFTVDRSTLFSLTFGKVITSKKSKGVQ